MTTRFHHLHHFNHSQNDVQHHLFVWSALHFVSLSIISSDSDDIFIKISSSTHKTVNSTRLSHFSKNNKAVSGTANLASLPPMRVLPPGEFNGIILEPLTVYSECLVTISVTVSNSVAMVTNSKLKRKLRA